MRLDSRTHPVRGRFFREDTGERVRWVRWYDDETLEYERFRIDPDVAKANGIALESIIARGRGRLRFVPDSVLTATLPPPVLAVSLNRPVTVRRKGARLLIVPGLPPPECDEPKCHAPAIWGVLDEQEVEPSLEEDGRLYARAKAAGQRVYCDKHYRYPTTTNLRGVTHELTEVVQP